MTVDVDQAGTDDLAAGVVYAARIGGRNVRGNGGNLVALDRDVHHR